MDDSTNRRVLIIDDNRSIHDDFSKVLGSRRTHADLAAMEADMFGSTPASAEAAGFELTFACQGQEAVGKVREAFDSGAPFAMAFVDIRMPPGWDGVETSRRIWEIDPRMQIVICSAYSDYSWDQMRKQLGAPHQLLILKKPFDPIEVLQLAHALTEKWQLLLASRRTVAELETAVAKRTESLETTNRRLVDEVRRRQETEALLVRAQKLEALGRIAGGIAHEINNPLSVVSSSITFVNRIVQALETPVPGQADLREASAEALAAAHRIHRIVNEVKLFARSEAAPLAAVAPDAIVRRAIEHVGDDLAKRGEVTVELADLPDVVGREEGLVQVLCNLLSNAAAALPEHGGRIRILGLELPDGRIALEVADNGSGIAPENMAKIFEPFFTTKEVGCGTGLGLSICHGIVTSLGGEMSVESTYGEGTRFRVILQPANTAAAMHAAG